MRISRLIDMDILVADNDLVRGKTCTDAHNCTTAQTHTRTGVCGLCRCVHFVQPVQSVQFVQFVQCLLIITNSSFLITNYFYYLCAKFLVQKGNAF